MREFTRHAWLTVGVVLPLALLGRVASGDTNVSSAIPLDSLSKESRQLVIGIAERSTFEVKIGPRECRGTKAVFEYLLEHLELCAIAGRAVGLGKYQTRREKDGRLFGDDGEGATGYLTFLHVADGKRIFFVDGTQRGIFTVGGKSIVALDFASQAAERSVIEYRLHVWVHVDNAFFAFLSRLFLGASKRTANQQFTKMLSIPVGVTAKAHENPRAVLEAFDKLEGPERAALKDLGLLIDRLYLSGAARSL